MAQNNPVFLNFCPMHYFLCIDFQLAVFRQKRTYYTKNGIFWPNFHQMGAILGTFISQNMFLAIFLTTSYVGRVFGETTIYFMALLLKNGRFFLILGHF